MKKYLIAATLLAGLGTAGMALADDDDCRVPMADWQPREAVQKMAEDQGWSVRRIKIDDGCYEIKGLDAQARKIKVKIDPGTLAIVTMKIDYRGDRGTDGDVIRNETSTPPANGLFTPGSKTVVE